MLFVPCKICGKDEKYEKPIHLQIIQPSGIDITIADYKICGKCFSEKIIPLIKGGKALDSINNTTLSSE